MRSTSTIFITGLLRCNVLANFHDSPFHYRGLYQLLGYTPAQFTQHGFSKSTDWIIDKFGLGLPLVIWWFILKCRGQDYIYPHLSNTHPIHILLKLPRVIKEEIGDVLVSVN